MTYDVGDIATATLTVDPFDETTAASATVRAPDGTETTPTPTPGNDNGTWTTQVPITAAGTWYVYWTVAGTGAGAQTDTLTADPTPPLTEEQRRVRLLISDTNPASRFFSTLEINDFLAMNGENVRRAAAQALDAWAANEAMVSKKIRTQDLSTDGPAVAKELRAAATELRRQADAGDGDAEAGSGFEVVEFEPYPCRGAERAWY